MPPASPDPSQQERYVQDLFRRVARRYDLLNRTLSMRQDVRWRRFTAVQARLQSGDEALDVATGTGDLAFELARHVLPGGKVMGVDFVAEMLALADAKAARMAQGPACKFMWANALELPFARDRFAAATIAFGLRNVVDRLAALREMRRVVKPGGRVLILELSHPRWPLFKQIYHAYFHGLVPLLGRWIQGDADTYRYLPDSVAAFPDQDALVDLLHAAGLKHPHYYNFMGGIAALHIGDA